MEYGVDIAQDFFRAVVVLIFGVYKRPELGAEVFNSLFALKWVNVFEESSFAFFPALWWWVEIERESIDPTTTEDVRIYWSGRLS